MARVPPRANVLNYLTIGTDTPLIILLRLKCMVLALIPVIRRNKATYLGLNRFKKQSILI